VVDVCFLGESAVYRAERDDADNAKNDDDRTLITIMTISDGIAGGR
jgi:hypothetical protein